MSVPATDRFDVAVTGIGLVTPAGLGVAANRARVWSGESCASTDESPAMVPTVTCRVPDFHPDALLGRLVAFQLDRFAQLAIVAAREAIEDADLDSQTWEGNRVGVVLGNSLGGSATVEDQNRVMRDEGPTQVSPLMVPMHMVNMAAGHVAIHCSARGPSLATATACASGTTAVGTARELLRSGACDVVLAGGTESALTPLMLAGLQRMGALSGRVEDPEHASRPFDAERDGFVAAEGAGILVLERVPDALARFASPYALVSGYGASSDAYHATAPEPEGYGIERAVRAALDDARMAPSEVQHVNAHGTSTPLNDVTEARALHRLFGINPAVTSTKGVIGHTLAAAGAIEAAYTALAIGHRSIPPTANLKNLDPEIDIDIVAGQARDTIVETAVSTSLGFGGHNAALVMTSA